MGDGLNIRLLRKRPLRGAQRRSARKCHGKVKQVEDDGVCENGPEIGSSTIIGRASCRFLRLSGYTVCLTLA